MLQNKQDEAVQLLQVGARGRGGGALGGGAHAVAHAWLLLCRSL